MFSPVRFVVRWMNLNGKILAAIHTQAHRVAIASRGKKRGNVQALFLEKTMNQTPITTRESIQTLCAYTSDMHSGKFNEQDRLCKAVALLCEQYGLRLADYFPDA